MRLKLVILSSLMGVTSFAAFPAPSPLYAGERAGNRENASDPGGVSGVMDSPVTPLRRLRFRDSQPSPPSTGKREPSIPQNLPPQQLSADSTAERLVTLGREAFDHGDAGAASIAWEQAAGAFKQNGNAPRQIDAMLLLGAAYQTMGQATRSIETLDGALPIARKSGDRHRLVEVLDALGSVRGPGHILYFQP